MHIDETLEKYGLTRDTAARYIEAITHLNQTQTADELGVSRATINRYKKAFNDMTAEERALLAATLLHEQLLKQFHRQ